MSLYLSLKLCISNLYRLLVLLMPNQAVTSACNGSFWEPTGSRCAELLEKVDKNVRDLNIYDILEPCYQNPDAKETEHVDAKMPSGFRRLGETDRPLPVRERMVGHPWPNRAPVRDGVVPELLSHFPVDCTVTSRHIRLWSWTA